MEQSILDIWNTMKRPNLRIIKRQKGEEIQVKTTENIFNKIIEDTCSNVKKEVFIKLNTEWTGPKMKVLMANNNQNKGSTVKAAKEKDQVTYKVRTIKITPDFSAEIQGL